MTYDFEKEFINAELEFVASLRRDSTHRANFKANWDSLLSRFTATARAQAIPQTASRSVLHSTQNIKRICQHFETIEKTGSRVATTLKADLTKILRGQASLSSTTKTTPRSVKKPTTKSTQRPPKVPVDDAALEEETRYRPCRNYFLEHLGSPYPTASEKKKLAEEVGCEVAQIGQWFTNHRRRLGWLDVMKTYAQDNKAAMLALVRDVLRDNQSTSSTLISAAARRAVLEVKERVLRITMPNVSDVFREALSMEPMSEKELAEYADERKAARKQLEETMAMKRALEQRKARKAARFMARGDRATNLEAGADRPVASSFAMKRKRSDENTSPVSGGANGSHSVKKVRLSEDTGTPPKVLSSSKSPVESASPSTESHTYGENAASPLVLPKRKRLDDQDDQDDGTASQYRPRHPTSSKRRRLVDQSDAQRTNSGNPPRVPSAPSTSTASHTYQVPFLIPDPDRVADLRRTSSLPNKVGLGAFTHQYGDSMLPPLTSEEQVAFLQMCHQPTVAQPAPMSSTQSLLNQHFSAPPTTSGTTFSLSSTYAGGAVYFQDTAPTDLPHTDPSASFHYTDQLEHMQQPHLIPVHTSSMTPAGVNRSTSQFGFEMNQNSCSHSPSQNQLPQSYDLNLISAPNDASTPAGPEMYDFLLQTLHDQTLLAMQPLPASNAPNSSQTAQLSDTGAHLDLPSNDNPATNPIFDFSCALEWSASTPPFSLPSPFDLLPQPADSPRGSSPPRSRNVSASSSFSMSSDVGSDGAMRRSRSPAGQTHPYPLSSRLESFRKKQRELEEKKAEIDREEAQLRMELALSQAGFESV